MVRKELGDKENKSNNKYRGDWYEKHQDQNKMVNRN
jgi:hypothetical protein